MMQDTNRDQFNRNINARFPHITWGFWQTLQGQEIYGARTVVRPLSGNVPMIIAIEARLTAGPVEAMAHWAIAIGDRKFKALQAWAGSLDVNQPIRALHATDPAFAELFDAYLGTDPAEWFKGQVTGILGGLDWQFKQTERGHLAIAPGVRGTVQIELEAVPENGIHLWLLDLGDGGNSNWASHTHTLRDAVEILAESMGAFRHGYNAIHQLSTQKLRQATSAAPVCEIWAGGGHHAPATIAANREGLLAILAATQAALDGGAGVLELYGEGGEGYTLTITQRESE